MSFDPEGQRQHGQEATLTALAPPARSTNTGSPRRYIPFALLGVLTIGAGVAAYVAVRDNATPSQAVASALTHSLALKSAALTSSIEIDEPGGNAAIKLEGTTNFDTGATNESLQIDAGIQRISERVISDGPKIYVHLDGGAIAKVAAGKSWVSVPSGKSTASSSAVGGGVSASSAILRALSAPGDNVSGLGSSRVHGVTVHLYSVHLTRSQIKHNLSQEHLPRFMRQDTAGLNIPAITYTLAVDNANRLTELKGTVDVRTGGPTIVEHLEENFLHYGTKVTVTAPRPSEVIPLQTFLHIAAEKGENVLI